MMVETPGVEDISLTTNGLLLEDQIEGLAQAGLKRINVSLDTLDPVKFSRITRGGSLEKVLRGLQKAEEVGIQPIKLNVVMMRGVNDDELLDLAARAGGRRTPGMRAVGGCARVLGWRWTGRLCGLAERLFSRRPGPETMDPSWS